MVALLLLGGACNDNATAEDAARFCQASCDRKARCGTTDPDCLIQCQQDTDRFAIVFRACYFQGAADCEATRPCSGVSGDACDTAGVYACGPTANDQLYSQCMTVRSSCKATGKSTLDDDHCAVAPALNDDARSRLTTCLNLACEEQSGCAKAALGH